MKLIIIYGPPAAGKLTVGTELARLTGFKLFHNHLSIDYVKIVFEFGRPAFWRVVGNVRFETIAEAAREDIDLIHTFCYEFGSDDEHFRKLISSAQDNGGEVHLVLLRCSEEERKKRFGNESRVRIGKLTDLNSFNRKQLELSTPLPGRPTFIIDTTRTPPKNAARQIVDRFGLGRRQLRSED